MAEAIIIRESDGVIATGGGDGQVIGLWLYGKSAATQRAYLADSGRLLAFAKYKPLAAITLADLQAFELSLGELSTESRRRIVNSIKSLLTFCQKIGYLQFNVGAAFKAPKTENRLAERILTEQEVLTMIALTKKERDRVLLTLLYASAGRCSEVCALQWRNVQPSGKSGQVTLFGKGGKTRAVKLSAATWKALLALRGAAGPDEPVFVSQKGGALDESAVRRIVKAAAVRAGVPGDVSPHWLRHSHASHALDRGANIVLVRDTLGHSSLAVTSRYTHAKPNDSSALHLAV
jgi:integrase/recombinase XerD